jgi:signal transduction histidine kinase/ActR/RegA family two-component response regulator
MVSCALSLAGACAEHASRRSDIAQVLDSRSSDVVRMLHALVDERSTEQSSARVDEYARALASQSDVEAWVLVGARDGRVRRGSDPAWSGRFLVEIPELAQPSLLAALERGEGSTILDAREHRHVRISRIADPSPDAGRANDARVAVVWLDASRYGSTLWRDTVRAGLVGLGMAGVIGLLGAAYASRAMLFGLAVLRRAIENRAEGEISDLSEVPMEMEELRALAASVESLLAVSVAETRDLQRSEAELRLLGQISRVADRTDDFDQAMTTCLRLICRFLCWPIGHFYVIDQKDRSRMLPGDLWHVSCPDVAQSFVERTRSLTFEIGEGLPGRVLESAEPLWIEDTSRAGFFVRYQPGDGAIRAAVGFPAMAGNEVIAVVELFDFEPRERDIRSLALVHNIGLTLGQLLHRHRSRELLLERNAELADALQRARAATEAKTQFLANMSHEIRTPMNAILGYAELLPETTSETDRIEYIAAIRRNGQHLLGLINDILDVSKIEVGRLLTERIECSPGEILHNAIEMMAPKAADKHLSLRLRYDTPVPETIRTDPTRLRQILINLLSNAMKFTEHGGVELVAGLATAEGAKRPLLRVHVVDTGIGISPSHLSRLFEPFSQADDSMTRRFGGTGLGLSISRSLAELLGGELTVESEEGEGSTFTLTIDTGPLEGVRLLEHPDQVPRATVDATASLQAIELDDVWILVAEDGPDNQRLMNRILSGAGAKVEIVANGQLALDRALAARDQGRPYDVILMDMQMPVMDGYEATRRLRLAGYRGRIVALTAHAMRGDEEKCLRAGCDTYLSKPVAKRDLLRAIAEG